MRYREILEAIKNDDDMFSTSSTLATGAKQAIKQIEDPYLRTVRRVRELAKTKFGIKTRVSSVPKSASRGRATFWFGDYVRDSNDPYDKAPEAPPVAQEIKAELERQGFECKFTGSGWLSVLVPPAYSDLLREENDDDMFGSSTRPDSKVIAQDLELWLRRRQSSSRRPIIPSSENYVKQVIAAFNQNFLKGVETWREYPLYGNTDIKYDIREYLENSLNVNLMDYVDQVNENDESDDELFGDGKQKVYVVTAPDDEILGMFDDVREAIAHAKKQVPIYLEDGWGDDDLITVYKQNWGEESGVPVAHFPITDDPIDENDESDEDLFAAPTIRFGDFFNEYDEDQLQALGFSYGDYPEEDVDIINHYLEDGPVNWRVLKLTDASGQGDDIVLHLDRSSRLGEDESDDDMFGTSASAGQRMIYTYGKRLLHKLEQAYNNPQIKQKYLKVTQDDEDGDEPFRLVLQATGAEFGKAFVVDTIIREFAGGMEGLNDFGWMIDDGIFDELTNGWEEFGRSTDVANQDWFRKELQTFMGDR